MRTPLKLVIIGIICGVFCAASAASQASADDSLANLNYLTSLARVVCGESAGCFDRYMLYINSSPVPNSTANLPPYEAGMIANICTQAPPEGNGGFRWDIAGIDCFQSFLSNSREPELRNILSVCHADAGTKAFSSNKPLYDCEEAHLKPFWDVKQPARKPEQSCEAKLTLAEQRILENNPGVLSNSRELKKLQAIFQAIKSEDSSAGGTD